MGKKFRHYTDEQIGAYLDSHRASGLSAREFAKKIHVPRETFSRWKRRDGKEELVRHPKRKCKPGYSDIEDELYTWLMSERSKGLIVTRVELKERALEMAQQKGYPKFKASTGWLTKFFRRKMLSLRVPTHHARKAIFTEKDLDEELEFLLKLYSSVVFESTPTDHIFNFDQTMIRLVSPKAKTYSPKGSKEVIVKEPPGEKEGITVALTIRADGGKYPAVIVFKGGVSGHLSDKIVASLKIPSNVVVCSSSSTWWTETLDHEWIRTTFGSHQSERVLVRDQAPVHKLESSELLLREKNVVQIFIPAGRTGEYQPLDVSVNKALKSYFRAEYQRWRHQSHDVTKSGYLKKPGRQDFINMISAAWEKVSNDIVRKSFYSSSILVEVDLTQEKENVAEEMDLAEEDELEISLFSDSVLMCDENDTPGEPLSNSLPE